MSSTDPLKLTLLMGKKNIQGAKLFAKRQGTSLSRIVENLFARITRQDREGNISPLVKEISGVISQSSAPDGLKESYHKHLDKKYR